MHPAGALQLQPGLPTTRSFGSRNLVSATRVPMGCTSPLPSLEPLHSASPWASGGNHSQEIPNLLHKTQTTLPLQSARLSAQDVPTRYYNSSPPDSYNLVISKQWTSGFTPHAFVRLQQGAQRTFCLVSSCTPALFGACPSHSDFCKLPGEPSTGMLNLFCVFRTRGLDLKFYSVENSFCICFQYYLF